MTLSVDSMEKLLLENRVYIQRLMNIQRLLLSDLRMINSEVKDLKKELASLMIKLENNKTDGET